MTLAAKTASDTMHTTLAAEGYEGGLRGRWNSGIALLRNNGLIEADGRRFRAAALFQASA
jgi:hypothetical protein